MNTFVSSPIQGHRALRFLTAGSFDDGKSTLIGRLLYYSRAILAEQCTRNMVTAAAGSDAAVVLVNTTKLDTHANPVKLLARTRRHSLLAQLLRVHIIVFSINKLDTVHDPDRAHEAVRSVLLAFAEEADMEVAGIVPVSALRGDSVTQPLDADWYDGPSLLRLLERLPTAQERKAGGLLIPVQYVSRDGDGTGDQLRTLWGRIAHGSVKAGDEVQVFPSRQKAFVSEVRLAGSLVMSAAAGQSAGIALDRQLDVSRGDWISTLGTVHETTRFSATLAWLDIHSLQATDAHELNVNEIGPVIIETQQPLPIEAYETHRDGSALIIVDPTSNRTSGAVLVKAAA